MTWRTSASVAALFAMLAIACTGDRAGDARTSADSSSRPRGAQVRTGASATTGAPSAGSPARVAPDSTGAIPITARLSEYRIDLSPIEVNEGKVAITLQNEGERVHTIDVRGDNGMRWRTLPIRPGNSVTLRMDLPPGRYVVRSIDPAYVDRGMSAFLLVR